MIDKVWHEGIIFKLKQNGISGELLNLLCDFLRNRKQRVVLKDKFCGGPMLTQESHRFDSRTAIFFDIQK